MKPKRTHVNNHDNLRLTTINGVKGLIQKHANGPAGVYPRRTVLVHGRCIVEHSQNIGNHEAETREGDLYPSRFRCYISRDVTLHDRLRGLVCRTTQQWFTRKNENMYLRHPHGEAIDDKVVVKRLQNVLGDITVINARVLVLFQLRQPFLADVDHVV